MKRWDKGVLNRNTKKKSMNRPRNDKQNSNFSILIILYIHWLYVWSSRRLIRAYQLDSSSSYSYLHLLFSVQWHSLNPQCLVYYEAGCEPQTFVYYFWQSMHFPISHKGFLASSITSRLALNGPIRYLNWVYATFLSASLCGPDWSNGLWILIASLSILLCGLYLSKEPKWEI